tara:strand:+ start:1832 stop:1951 length:120 start_codon:yes stop_codon:yes gene_type:complete
MVSTNLEWIVGYIWGIADILALEQDSTGLMSEIIGGNLR